MPVDLRSALCSALDVAAPPLRIARVRERAAARLRALKRRRTRSMLSIAAFVAATALFAGGYAPSAAQPAVIAAVPAPAPAPRAT